MPEEIKLDLDELKRLAEEATPGPWVKSAPGEVATADFEVDGEVMCDHIASGFGCGSSDPDDAAFVAAANPAVVLALIAEVKALLQDAERYRALRKVTPYRFKKMQEASVTDGGDVFYFHADRFDAAIDEAMSQKVAP